MQVYELLRDTFAEMGLLTTGLVTGSPSKTILTDANAALTADNLINGVLFALDGTNAGTYRRITDNAATTITVATMTASFSTGDYYGYIKKEFRSQDLTLFVNMALKRIGKIGVKDTSLTTASNQTEYTLPNAALKQDDIYGIYLQTVTNDSDNNQWYPLTNYHVQPNTANNASTIILDQLPASRTLLIEYVGFHPTITAGVDYINEAIHPELAKAALKLVLGNRRAEGAIGSQDGYNQLYNKYSDEFEKAKIEYPVWMPEKRPVIFRAYTANNYPETGEPNKVEL